MTSKLRQVSRSSTIRTFLIADIRGWTRFTRELGDEAASRLASKFAQIVHEAVEAWGGQLLELRGDEALVTSESARRALHCAVELQEAFADETALAPELPLNVGIGLDAGEAVPVGDGYRGTSLNVAARLCSTAQAGEVIATASLAHLAGRVAGLTFADLDARPMKGFDEPVAAVLVDSARPHEHGEQGANDAGASAPPLPPELDAIVPLVGREADLRWLGWHWRRARHGHGGAVVVSGPRGIGRTRLAAELARLANQDGAAVTYRRTDGELAVVDDVDALPDHELDALFQALASRTERRLIVLTAREPLPDPIIRRFPDLRADDRRRRLGPIDLAAVTEIGRLYLDDPDVDVPAHLLLEESDGIPAAVHRVASQWARATARRRLGQSARRTSRERRDLHAAEAAMVDDVARLELSRERARLYVQDVEPEAEVPNAPVRAICPYKGLAAFEAADSEYYFGRERLVAELIAKMVGSTFVGLIGASGSGKSSALQAGLLPALSSGVIPGSDEWIQVTMRPGEHPIRELQHAFHRDLPQHPDADASPAASLDTALAELAPAERVLLVVDQFEELFASGGDEGERNSFIELVTELRPRLKVLVAVRADQYQHCAAYPRLARLIGATQVLVGPLTAEEIAAIIRHPAERVGLHAEPELVDILVADIGTEPGGLPLLSTALLELWETREDSRLTLSAYRATGGVRGAVARLAESVYTRLSSAEQATARSIFLRLAGETDDGATVRRRVPIDELHLDDAPESGSVLAALTDGRLLTATEGYVEVAHEALLREWPRLRAWIEEDSSGRQVRLHLMSAARTWDDGGREPGDLYRGARLATVLDWRSQHGAELNATERAFLDESEAAFEREAAEQRRTNRRLRGLLTGTAAFLVIALAAGAVAFSEARRADAEARAARASELYAAAVATVEDDPELAILLAQEARTLGVEPGPDAVTALHRAVALQRSVRTIELPPTEPRPAAVGVALSPDGDIVYAAANSASVDAYSVETGEHLQRFGTPRSDLLLGYLGPVVSPDGRRLAIMDEEGLIHVWDIASAEEQVFDTGGRRANWSIFDDDGSHLAAVSHLEEEDADDENNALVTLFDVERGELVQSWKVPDAWSVSFGPDPNVLHMTACPCFRSHTSVDLHVDSGEVEIIVGLVDGEPVGEIEELGATGPTAARITPDAATLVTASRDGGVYAWDARTGERVRTFSGHDGFVSYLAMSADGGRFATTSSDGTTKVWQLGSSDPLVTLTGQGGVPGFAAFSADGAHLATGSSNLTARVWNLSSDQGEVGAFALDDEFRQIWELDVEHGQIGVLGAPGDGPFVATVIDAVTGQQRDAPRLAGLGMALAPGGEQIIAQRALPDPSNDGEWIAAPLRSYDVAAGEESVEFDGLCDVNHFDPSQSACGPPPAVPWNDVAFTFGHSADGSLVAMLGTSDAVAVWTGEGHLVAGPLVLPTDFALHLAMSPDGELLAVSALDEVFILDARTLDEITRLPVSVAIGLRFSPDGSTLLVASGTTETRLYRTDDWSFEQLGAFSVAVDFNSSGERFVTLDADRNIRLWEIGRSGALVDQTIPIERMHLRSYANTPKGFIRFVNDTHIAMVDSGVVSVYTTDIDELFSIAADRLTRALTEAECETYVRDTCPPPESAHQSHLGAVPLEGVVRGRQSSTTEQVAGEGKKPPPS